ncbi:hypothetical protein ABIB75_007683 [Bradyrhizobium sp. GM2.2]|uniref:hypothetical protein n=1 Tax=Bradyrhizobium sp. GM2.2 TaxID=3156358 RepID=UPI003392FFED
MPSALILSLLLFIVTAQSAFGGQKGTWREHVDLVMRSVEDLNQKGAGSTLARLRDASSWEWPGSFYTEHEGSRCSATLIGPTALLLAAQCIPDGGEVVIEFRGLRRPGTCKHSESTAIGDQTDFALCSLFAPIEGIQFDTVNLNSARITRGTEVLISSFSGCPRSPIDRPTEARFRISEAVVVSLPREGPQNPNSIIVRGNTGVCPGDGGGIAYIALASKRRLVVGVNYRSDKGESYISSLSTQNGQAFLKRWTEKVGASVCGVNYEGSSCR